MPGTKRIFFVLQRLHGPDTPKVSAVFSELEQMLFSSVYISVIFLFKIQYKLQYKCTYILKKLPENRE